MNKKIDLELCIFIYSILFLPKIGLLDLKLFALAIFCLLAFARGKKMHLHLKLVRIAAVIALLLVLFGLNSLANNTDYLIAFRYIRCGLSIVCTYNYISSRKLDLEVIIKSFLAVLSIHAIAVILCVTVPSIRPYINIISGYSKKELPLRSAGLMSGYDYAGFMLNVGLVLSVLYNIKYKNKVFGFTSVLYVVSVIFTSRLNTVFLMLQIICIIFYMLKSRRLSLGVGFMIIVPIVLVGSVFTILTIDVFLQIKQALIIRYDWIDILDRTINNTYSVSSLETVILEQFSIADRINYVIGNGIKAPSDPGIINTIYEAGWLGMFLKVFAHISTGVYCLKKRKISIAHVFVVYIVLVSTFYEAKLVFYFATTAFELLILFFSAALIEEEKIYINS